MPYNTFSPNLKQVEAEHAVALRFSKYGNIERIDSLLKFCHERARGKELPRVYLRLQRLRLSLLLVDIVLASLPESQREFILCKYRDRKSISYIEHHLNLSPRAQQSMYTEFIREVTAAEDYRLLAGDAYRRCKVLNMLHVLDERINTFVDERIACNQSWLNKLMHRRNNCAQLLGIMQEIADKAIICEKNQLNYMFYQVVNTKLQHPDEPGYIVASMLGVRDGTVSKHLTRYHNMVKRYLV